jgi:hypothetical protein
MSQVEVYFAVGEVAEELGRVATTREYRHDCYARAAQFFQAALTVARSMKEYDYSYVVRCYQRYACILEERMLVSPELSEEIMKILAGMLKEEVTLMQYPVLPVDGENL